MNLSEKIKSLQEYQNILTHVIAFFGGLQFDAESHTYNVNKQKLTSVSSTIKKYVEPFDAKRIAGYVARSRGISREEVLDEWEDKKNVACDKGNRVHDFGEHYANSLSNSELYKPAPIDGYEKSVIAFWDSVPEHIIPFTMELQMFCLELGIAGTADIILYNTKTGKFIIADYKTNIDLFKNYKGKKMLAPFEGLLDCPYNKYQLQLSFYQMLFEQCGFEVEDRKVVWLQEDGSFKVYKTQNWITEIKASL